MNTPTDDEIVKYVLAQDWGYAETAIRQALRLAREGLPVKYDEATTLAHQLYRCGSPTDAASIIRTFLTDRDAKRNTEVAELVAAAYYALNWIKVINHEDKRTTNLSAALAKLERKS